MARLQLTLAIQCSSPMKLSWSTSLSDILTHFTGMPTGLANAIEICMYILLLILVVRMSVDVRLFVKRYRSFVIAAQESKSLPQDWRTDQPWRQATDIRFIEGLKADLSQREGVTEECYARA